MVNSERYILLCITSDTIIALSAGTFDEVTEKQKGYEDICKATGSKLRIESITSAEQEKELLTSASKLMETYKHLL